MKKITRAAVKILLKLIAAAAIFFVVTFAVYFFNLDMKLTSAMEPLMEKVYDNFVKRDQHL